MNLEIIILSPPEISGEEKWRNCVDEQIQNIVELSRKNPQIVRDTITFLATMLIDVNNIIRQERTGKPHR